MSRTFKTVDYEAPLNQPVRLGDCLPPDHLARLLRGEAAAAGEWCLVCLAFDLKRLHSLTLG